MAGVFKSIPIDDLIRMEYCLLIRLASPLFPPPFSYPNVASIMIYLISDYIEIH